MRWFHWTLDQYMAVYNPPNAVPIRLERVTSDYESRPGGPAAAVHTKALYQAAKALPRIGVAALRFNFRGVGRSAGTFDSGQGEKDDFKAAIDFVAARFPGLPVWAAGMSFGSWVAMTSSV